MDDVQAMLERIRQNVFDEVEQKFADEAFQHLRYSLHRGQIADADGVASMVGESSEIMVIYLKFGGERVDQASYVTDGGGTSCLSGSCVAELARGKTTEELMKIKASDVVGRLKRTGDGVEKSALLAVETLHRAVEKYWMTKKGGTAQKERSKAPRFLAVGSGSSHMQYSH